MESSVLYSIWKQNRKISTDSRSIIVGSIFFALRGDNFNGNLYAAEALEKGASYAVIDDNNIHVRTDDRYIIVEDVLKSLQQLANQHRKTLNIPVLGITGSNGKTTTKELVRDVIATKYKTFATKGNLNNHIGVPLTILSVNDDIEFLIVEMGANHQGEIAALCEIAEPNFAMITNIGKAHLEGFGGIEGVKKGKSEMYRYVSQHHGQIFINDDDAALLSLLPSDSNLISYSANKNVNIIQEEPYLGFEFEGRIVNTKLYGLYNRANIGFAIAAGIYFGVNGDDICNAIANYSPENNRSQVQIIGTTTVIRDAYNANPTSMRLSLESFAKMHGRKIVVIGDMLELGEYSLEEHKSIIELSESLKFDDMIFIGKQFLNAKSDTGNYFIDVDEARNYFKTCNIENTTILLKGSRGISVEKILDT
jgi:UDP-N-acetylmuramoyl-tripeptide--D-alanyl-D-alanine ligase